MLKIDNLSASYDNTTVISDLSYTFNDGKKYAIIGPSGVGKTTLLNILAGLKKPTSGSVETTYSHPTYIFQEPRLFPWLNSIENIQLVCNDREKSISLLKRLIRDDDAYTKYPHELSGGMKQRVAIARALSYDSDIVFMDEPFNSLDIELRKDVRKFVFEYLKYKTVIMITHEMADTEFCDTILKMEGSPVSDFIAEESGRQTYE